MLRSSLLSGITKYWWLPLLTGLICLGFGVWTICAPSQALPIIAMAFAIGLLVVGLFDAIWGFVSAKTNPAWGWELCMAVIDIVAGIWMLTMNPAEMTMTFLYVVGIWMIFAAFNGLGQMLGVNYYNGFGTVIAVLLLLGTLFFSFWLILNPVGLGIVAWMWVGIALSCYGVYRIALACRVKSIHNKVS